MIKLDELEVYKVALEIGDIVWKIVSDWKHFEKDTLGKQFVRAADSIALNISEGYGRFHYAENRNFCYYSRGSAYETVTIIKIASERNLIQQEQNDILKQKLNYYFRLITPYIKSIGNIKHVESDK